MRTRELLDQVRSADLIDLTRCEAWTESPRAQEVLSRILAASSEAPDAARLHPRSQRVQRRLLSGAAVVTAVAVAVVVLPIVGRDQNSTAVADALRAVALVAERRSVVVVPAASFQYTKSESAVRGYVDACSLPPPSSEPCPRPAPDDWAFSVLTRRTREIWIAADGSGRLVTRSEAPRFFGPADRAEWEAAGSPPLDRRGVTDELFGPGGLSHTDLSRYSTDPEELYDQIRRKAQGYGPSLEGEMLVLVGDLLRETAAPPQLRAALYRVAARIPGVELVGNVTDPAGRQGVAVARVSDDVGFSRRVELIFDPESSELLAEREVLLERVEWADAVPGTVIGYTVYLVSGFAESVEERP